MKRLAGPVLFLLISICFCWRLVLTNQYTWLDSPDIAYQVLPWLQMQAGEWRQGHVPLWDPYQWMGQPLIGQGQPGVMNPLNWTVLSIPLRRGWIRQSALHWYYVELHFLAGLFLYLLCRDLALSRWASILGACVFAFGGFVSSNDWPQMLSGAVWIPLVILFLLRAVRGAAPMRSAALSGMFLGLSWLSGHHQIPIFVTLAWAGLWIYFIFAAGKLDRTLARAAALSLLVMVLVSAVQTFPAYEYGRLAKRWAGVEEPLEWNQAVPYTVHQEFSLKPEALVGVVIPGVFGHVQPFVGAIAFALALLGIWTERSKTTVHVSIAVAVFGLLLTIGGFTLFHGVLYALIPFVEKARTPAMAIVLFHFGVAVLCAYGADAYRSGLRSKEVRWTAYALLCFGLILFLVPVALFLANVPLTNNRVVASSLFALVAGAGLLWVPGERSSGPALLGLLICCELSLMFNIVLPSRYDQSRHSYLAPMSKLADVAGYLRSRPQPFRVHVDDSVVHYNFGDWFGIEQMMGYLASLTANTGALEYVSPATHQLLGVEYYLGNEPLRPDQELLYTGESGVKVFRNPGAFQRVRLVHRVTQMPGKEELAKYIASGKHDFANEAPIVADPPQLENCTGKDEAALIKHSSSHSVILANAPCRALLVLSETSYPGWKAEVDGKPARIYEPYGMLRGVVIEKGSHRIEFRYRPASVILGAICTLAGLLLVAAVHLGLTRWSSIKHTNEVNHS